MIAIIRAVHLAKDNGMFFLDVVHHEEIKVELEWHSKGLVILDVGLFRRTP